MMREVDLHCDEGIGEVEDAMRGSHGEDGKSGKGRRDGSNE
jgi:hypothetical protein